MKKFIAIGIFFVSLNSFSCYSAQAHDKRMHDVQITRLDALLKSQLNFNDEQISYFTDQLLKSAELEALLTPELPTYICKGEEKIVLPTKILIVIARVLNFQRLCNGTYNDQVVQNEQRIIESHWTQYPDSDIRKITHDQGFYFTFDDTK